MKSYPSSWFQDLLNNSSLISIVAILDNDLIGVIVGTVTTLGRCNVDDRNLLSASFPLSTSVAYILSLGVTASYRSKGVASILLRSFIGYVSGENLEWLNNPDHHIIFSNSLDFSTDKVYVNANHNGNIIHANNRTTLPVPLYIKDYQSLYELIIHLPPVSPVQAVYLHVLHSNLPARRFYEKRGFICLHTRPGCYTIDGKPADGCTYVLHTNGGYLDVKSTNSLSNFMNNFFNEHSTVYHLRWIVQVITQSGYTILYKLSRLLHNLCDDISSILHLNINNNRHHPQQKQRQQPTYERDNLYISSQSIPLLYPSLAASVSTPSSPSSSSSSSSSSLLMSSSPSSSSSSVYL
uniref:N-alpha-acetyltransferase 60 n=1 Tax=Trichobilharzia regenti TaxID=157069 RepID=A0AA85IW79_TRIRE|nr:unnamed protein product [Trichobilharzia regenti]